MRYKVRGVRSSSLNACFPPFFIKTKTAKPLSEVPSSPPLLFSGGKKSPRPPDSDV